MDRIVIVGAGLGGLTVARELRALAPELAITLVTQDDGHQYPKPMLSTALRLGKRPDDLIRARAEELAALGIEVLARRSVVKLDAAERTLALDDGTTLAYRDLVLATGASPFVPDFEGDRDLALTVNHLDDYRRFRDRLHAEAPVLLIGGGLIGIEFASDLLASGHQVHVVDPGPGPLPRLLPPQAGALVTAALEKAGGVFHWGRTLVSLERTGPRTMRATLSDGIALDVGTVLSAVGLRPNAQLAKDAGLPVSRGVRVDERLKAADHVYALGDCAEFESGLYLPFIKPIGEQARHIARALASGEDAPFAMANYTITAKVAQWAVATTTPIAGEAGTWDETVHERGSLSCLLDGEGRLLRVVATGSETPSLASWIKEVPSLSAQGAPHAATPR